MELERAGGAFRIDPPSLGDQELEAALDICSELRMDFVAYDDDDGEETRKDDGKKRHYALPMISKKLERQLDGECLRLRRDVRV